jgi:hypothetical protein
MLSRKSSWSLRLVFSGCRLMLLMTLLTLIRQLRQSEFRFRAAESPIKFLRINSPSGWEQEDVENLENGEEEHELLMETGKAVYRYGHITKAATFLTQYNMIRCNWKAGWSATSCSAAMHRVARTRGRGS